MCPNIVGLPCRNLLNSRCLESCLSVQQRTSIKGHKCTWVVDNHVSNPPILNLVAQEEFVNEIFNRLYESLPKRQRSFVEEHIPGGGANGFAWADSLTTQLVHSGALSVLFMGTLANNPTDGTLSIFFFNYQF
jgi:hypothetical protein